MGKGIGAVCWPKGSQGDESSAKYALTLQWPFAITSACICSCVAAQLGCWTPVNATRLAFNSVHEMLAQLLVSVSEQVVCVCNNAFLAFAQHQAIKVPAAFCEHVAGHVCILLLLLRLPLPLCHQQKTSGAHCCRS